MERELVYNGSFYPKNISDINKFINKFIGNKKIINGLKAIIIPHAGWIYSGETALKGLTNIPKEEVKNIYLIGPSHRFAFKGVALSRFTSYKTVSSKFLINKDIEKYLLEIPEVIIVDDAHNYEHSLEVELEFIKNIYPNGKLIPIVIGRDSIEPLKTILKRSLNEKNSLTILSSDLSHYNPYRVAKELDSITINKILKCDDEIYYENACGSIILNALITVVKNNNFEIKLFDYKNSGDTAGDKSSVVGYCSMGIINNGDNHNE